VILWLVLISWILYRATYRSPAATIYLSDIPACYKKQESATRLFCLAPDGVFPRNTLLHSGVRSYRTFSPLPARISPDIGGIFSVALSMSI